LLRAKRKKKTGFVGGLKVSAVLIDDAGAIWPATQFLGETIGAPKRRNKNEFVIKSIAQGWIFVRPMRNATFVGIAPHLATDRSLFPLYRFLIKQNPVRIVISCDPQLSTYEIARGVARAIVRIEEIVADARRPQPRPLLSAERLPFDQLRRFEDGRLIPIAHLWHAANGRWRSEVFDSMREMGLWECATIMRQPRASDQLVIDHWGSKHNLYGDAWARIACGRDAESFPNRDIGLWRATMIRKDIAAGEPRLIQNDIVVRRHDGKLLRQRFVQLGVPWLRTSDGSRLFMSVNVDRHLTVLERPRRLNRR
jgi:hypothetical protein